MSEGGGIGCVKHGCIKQSKRSRSREQKAKVAVCHPPINPKGETWPSMKEKWREVHRDYFTAEKKKIKKIFFSIVAMLISHES